LKPRALEFFKIPEKNFLILKKPTLTPSKNTSNRATFTDPDYGGTNTINIAAITEGLSGGYHAAARYCSALVYIGRRRSSARPGREDIGLRQDTTSEMTSFGKPLIKNMEKVSRIGEKQNSPPN
jgi:hypothetical protein